MKKALFCGFEDFNDFPFDFLVFFRQQLLLIGVICTLLGFSLHFLKIGTGHLVGRFSSSFATHGKDVGAVENKVANDVDDKFFLD